MGYIPRAPSTDPRTYRDIQRTIAYADPDSELAESLYVPMIRPSGWDDLAPIERIHRLIDGALDDDSRARRVERALERARGRMGPSFAPDACDVEAHDAVPS